MLTQTQAQGAVELLPFLADPRSSIARAFASQATLARFPAGTTVFHEGDLCSTFSILASGEVRVFKIGETGREITLYRFGRGESCILTANCILSQQLFPAIAVVEQPAEAFVVPHAVFFDWIDEFSSWRTYVFQLLAQRFATVMMVVDEVAFRRMDARIAELLLRQTSPEQPALTLTHHAIAAELGTSREVVSRILADFAANLLVKLTRGTVTVVNRAGLLQRIEAR
jgi:CRP/FNR family transcriptional regulator